MSLLKVIVLAIVQGSPNCCRLQLRARHCRRKTDGPGPLRSADDPAARHAPHRHHVRRHRVLLEDMEAVLLREQDALPALRRARDLGNRAHRPHRRRHRRSSWNIRCSTTRQRRRSSSSSAIWNDRSRARRGRHPHPDRRHRRTPPDGCGARSSAEHAHLAAGRMDGHRTGSRAALPRILPLRLHHLHRHAHRRRKG